MSFEADSHEAPGALRGLWTREEIFTPSGYRDTTTRVFWLQTQRFYIDLRVPIDRPARPGASSFEPYTDEELISLARVQGFGGVLTASADVCAWRRDLDYHPPGEAPDEGRYEINGDRMQEFGIHAEYTEIWTRAGDSLQPLVAFQRDSDPGGLLVIAGNHFLEIQGRVDLPPPLADLATVVRQDLVEGRRDRAESRLGMRICYGRVASAEGPWRISLSTLPWLEGRALFDGEAAGFDSVGSALTRSGAGRWVVRDSSCSVERLAAILAPALADR